MREKRDGRQKNKKGKTKKTDIEKRMKNKR